MRGSLALGHDVVPVTASVGGLRSARPSIVVAAFGQLSVKLRVPLPRNEKRFAVPAVSVAVIVPVAGVASVFATV